MQALRLKVLAGSLSLLVWSAGPAADPYESALADSCAIAAQAFINSLESADQKLAAQSFDEDKRRIWSYGPNVVPFTLRAEGVALRHMSGPQRIAAHKLVACGLSSQGYQKSASIMWLDDILAQTDLYRDMADLPFGSDHYWLAVFGEPGGEEPWGWQYEGHHLVLNFTVADNQLVFAPVFMGADPAVVPDGERAGWRILGKETDKALLLINSLTNGQRDQAIIADEIPAGAATGRPGKGNALEEFAGIKVSELQTEQLLLFWSLLDEYVGNADAAAARSHLENIRADGLENIYFAWMGPIAPDSGIYYRIHSPSVIIEFVTARNRQSKTLEPNPNHVHTIFRYPGNDFGAGLLQRHYETSPHHQNR